ncbi:hypothetical protein SAMN04515620_10127 [Collimonas sp. OK607]|nr:hypothetical protein SAMN04515620_10127 [Collimonas sp. OK607]
MYVEFDLPEIAEYAAGFPQYWARAIFIQSPSNRYQINALANTYIRTWTPTIEQELFA